MLCPFTRCPKFTQKAKKGEKETASKCKDSALCCFYFDSYLYLFNLSKDLGKHGRQHHSELLQRRHLHPGYRELCRLFAGHPVRNLIIIEAYAVGMLPTNVRISRRT